MTYLQWRQDKGFRVGTTRTCPRPDARRPVSGVALRAAQERADAAWVLSTHATEAEARAEEAVVSLRHRLPTLPFNARREANASGLVADQRLIDRVFESVDTYDSGTQLLLDRQLEFDEPHHVPADMGGAPPQRDGHVRVGTGAVARRCTSSRSADAIARPRRHSSGSDSPFVRPARVQAAGGTSPASRTMAPRWPSSTTSPPSYRFMSGRSPAWARASARATACRSRRQRRSGPAWSCSIATAATTSWSPSNGCRSRLRSTT